MAFDCVLPVDNALGGYEAVVEENLLLSILTIEANYAHRALDCFEILVLFIKSTHAGVIVVAMAKRDDLSAGCPVENALKKHLASVSV